MTDTPSPSNASVPILDPSRRRLLGGLAGGTLAGVFGWQATEADRKRQRKRHDKSRKRQRAQGGDRQRTKSERNAGGRSSGDGASTRAGSSPGLKVLTQNLYLGADLSRLNGLASTNDLVAAVTEVFAMMQATDFPERAATLADEIASIDPHLVGLQEAIRWRSGTIETDFVDILLSELAARGKTYAVAATVDNLDAEAPYVTGAGLQLLHVTDRDVLLARTDLPEHVFSITNPQAGNFADQVIAELPGPDSATPMLVPIPAGWTAVDMNLHGETIRVVSTHLEPFAQDIQAGQRAELLDGPLVDITVPTVLMGDLNSPAPGGATYQKMLDAGFADAWTARGGHDPGFTSVQDETLRNPTSALSVRIDFVLTRGGITAASANRVGHRLEDHTPSGLWPSDHAGVWAVVQLQDG